MKLLLIILFSFSAMASYLPESLIGKDTNGKSIPGKMAACKSHYAGEKCHSIRDSGNHPYNKVIAEQTLEMQAQICIIDCSDELAALNCDDGYYPREGTLTVFCEKVIAEHVGIDSALKTAYDDAEAQKVADENNRRPGATLRQKLKDDGWSSLSDAQKTKFIMHHSRIK